jgi:hypothetical protein
MAPTKRLLWPSDSTGGLTLSHCHPSSFISIERKFADYWAVSDPAHHLRYFSGGRYKVSENFYICLLSPLSPFLTSSVPSFMLHHISLPKATLIACSVTVTELFTVISVPTCQHWASSILKALCGL